MLHLAANSHTSSIIQEECPSIFNNGHSLKFLTLHYEPLRASIIPGKMTSIRLDDKVSLL